MCGVSGMCRETHLLAFQLIPLQLQCWQYELLLDLVSSSFAPLPKSIEVELMDWEEDGGEGGREGGRECIYQSLVLLFL